MHGAQAVSRCGDLRRAADQDLHVFTGDPGVISFAEQVPHGPSSRPCPVREELDVHGDQPCRSGAGNPALSTRSICLLIAVIAI